jgi:excisionase family DNA binding protein
MTTEPWASVEDVARHLGVAKDSVYRWLETHSLPAHKLGRLWKFKLSEVDEWVRAGRTQSRAVGETREAAR